MTIQLLIEQLQKAALSASSSGVQVLIPGEEPYEIKEIVLDSGSVYLILDTQ
jgi:hypothetical protein